MLTTRSLGPRSFPSLFAALLLAMTFAAAANARAEPKSARDVTYATRPGKDGGKDVELQMNVVVPKETSTRHACIVCIHGGGWAAGKRQDLDLLTQKLAEQGFVAATISYEFAPAHKFPAQIIDAADAVRFLKSNSERFGIDPERIGAVGFSAGAHLAMLLGVGDKGDGLGIEASDHAPSAKVNAVVSFFGPTLLGANDYGANTTKILDDLIGAEPEGRKERAAAASPLTFVNKGDAPMLLLQGTEDNIVPSTQAVLMINALSKAGVPARCELIAGAGHGWGGKELERSVIVTIAFFKEQLDSKKAPASRPETQAAPEIGKDARARVSAAAKETKFELVCDETPELKAWGEQAVEICREWYPKLCGEYATADFVPRGTIKVEIRKTLGAPAWTAGDTISVNAEYLKNAPKDFGMVVHELFHVVQSYPGQKSDLGWLTEGIADYVRFWEYEPQTRQSKIGAKASYKNGYRVAGAFLAWLEQDKPGTVARLNAALRKGGADNAAVAGVIGGDIENKWKEFVAAGAPSEPKRP